MLKRLVGGSPSEERQPIVTSEVPPSSTSSPKYSISSSYPYSSSSSKHTSSSTRSSTPLALKVFPWMGWKWQKYLTYSISATFFLLGGLEYGVILPSLWQFLDQRFGVGDDGPFLGLVMSAFSATSFFASPLFGYIVDKRNNHKTILHVGCLFSVIGNILYFLAIDKWFVLWGRVLCGIGWSARPALLADITRTTSPEERTSIITIMMVFPQLGYFIGPAVNVVLQYFHFYMFGTILVDKFTAAGFLPACLFLLLHLFSIFFYFDLKRVQELEQVDKDEDKQLKEIMEGAFESMKPKLLVDEEEGGAGRGGGKEEAGDQDGEEMNENEEFQVGKCGIEIKRIPPTPPKKNSLDENFENENKVGQQQQQPESCGEKTPFGRSSFAPSPSSDYSSTFSPPPPKEEPTFFQAPLTYLENNINDEIIVSLCLVFNSTFAAVSIETAAFPLMDFFFGWTILENSMFGSVACAAVIITYFILHKLSKKYDDRVILLALQGIAIFSIFWLMIAYGKGMEYSELFVNFGGASGMGAIHRRPVDVKGISPGVLAIMEQSTAWQTLIIIGFAFFFVSVPSIGVIGSSLMSKVISDEQQGLGQGAQQNVMSIAYIIGPLWAGAFLWVNLYCLFGIEILLFLIVLCMYGGSWKRLKS